MKQWHGSCCSYYSASETSADQIKIKEQSAEYTVVLDDLQNLTDTSAYLVLAGTPSEEFSNNVLGTVTVTIGGQ